MEAWHPHVQRRRPSIDGRPGRGRPLGRNRGSNDGEVGRKAKRRPPTRDLFPTPPECGKLVRFACSGNQPIKEQEQHSRKGYPHQGHLPNGSAGLTMDNKPTFHQPKRRTPGIAIEHRNTSLRILTKPITIFDAHDRYPNPVYSASVPRLNAHSRRPQQSAEH